jgi:hypothetical protein
MFLRPGSFCFIRQKSLVHGTSADWLDAGTVSKPGVVGHEVEVGKIPGRLDEIARVVVVGHRPQGQPLVQADAPHPELARPLEHGIGDLLVVDEPPAIEALGGGPRVTLPRVDLEGGRLLVHEVEIALAELGRDEDRGRACGVTGSPG